MPDFPQRPTITVGDQTYPIFDCEIPPLWQGVAEEKGFEITARVKDRFHLVLRHDPCGAEMICKVFNLQTAMPVCPTCVAAERARLCREAGVRFLGAAARTHYLRIRLCCGHATERQTELLDRVRRGKTSIRCSTCRLARLEDEASARDWALIGADPEGLSNFRLYRHSCGHVQRVTIGNMTTGRFACGGCSDGWALDPSYIYAMRFVLQSGREAIKVGFSRDPESRLRHQLITDRDQYAMLIRKIAVPTGREAIRLEKLLHQQLRHQHPEAVLHRSVFDAEIKCVTELYDGAIEPVIMAHLDALEHRLGAHATGQAAPVLKPAASDKPAITNHHRQGRAARKRRR